MSRNPSNHTGLKVFLILLILLLIAGTAFLVYQCILLVDSEALVSSKPGNNAASLATTASTEETEETEPPTETTLPDPEHVVTTATVGAMGDILMHIPLFSSKYSSIAYIGSGEYNFDPIFKYISEYITPLDYAVANLETTLCGTDNGFAYAGYPNFNCPDEIAEGAKNAGFDMLLTANNHSYDTIIKGYKRTIEVVREAGLENLGTMLTPEEPKWTIQDVNGIKIGMMCYTYADSVRDGKPVLNGNSPVKEAGITNFFVYKDLESFYAEVEQYLAEMKEAGAEATMMYIHWGEEYQLSANDKQEEMAQKLCDLGIDVIVGGHPHVVQPISLLESTEDSNHKTICIYSVGNAVSNQRTGADEKFPGSYTEDGILFTVTFEKYSDGTVYLSDADVLPTWTDKHRRNKKLEYNIVPLDYEKVDQWAELFGVDDSTLTKLQKSYERTMGTVSDGLEECLTWLSQAKADREQYYYDLVHDPDKAAAAQAAKEAKAAEATAETTEETTVETVAETTAETTEAA